MGQFVKLFTNSAKELRSTRSLVGASLLLSMSIVLSFFLRLDLGPELRVGLAYIATALLGMLYGPVVAGMAAGAGDYLKYLLKPTGPYFFGFTLNAILAGVIYGIFFYKGKTGITRVILAKTAVNVLVNTVLGTYWLSLLYGDAYGVLFYPRLLKNVGMLPIECFLLIVTMGTIKKVLKRLKWL